MTRDEIPRAFDRMRVLQQGDRRAVLEPLLVLYALAKVGAGDTATMDWNAVAIRPFPPASYQMVFSQHLNGSDP